VSKNEIKTQKDLASFLGRNQTYISLVFRGRSCLKLKDAIRLHKEIGIDIEDTADPDKLWISLFGNKKRKNSLYERKRKKMTQGDER